MIPQTSLFMSLMTSYCQPKPKVTPDPQSLLKTTKSDPGSQALLKAASNILCDKNLAFHMQLIIIIHGNYVEVLLQTMN